VLFYLIWELFLHPIVRVVLPAESRKEILSVLFARQIVFFGMDLEFGSSMHIPVRSLTFEELPFYLRFSYVLAISLAVGLIAFLTSRKLKYALLHTLTVVLGSVILGTLALFNDFDRYQRVVEALHDLFREGNYRALEIKAYYYIPYLYCIAYLSRYYVHYPFILLGAIGLLLAERERRSIKYIINTSGLLSIREGETVTSVNLDQPLILHLIALGVRGSFVGDIVPVFVDAQNGLVRKGFVNCDFRIIGSELAPFTRGVIRGIRNPMKYAEIIKQIAEKNGLKVIVYREEEYSKLRFKFEEMAEKFNEGYKEVVRKFIANAPKFSVLCEVCTEIAKNDPELVEELNKLVETYRKIVPLDSKTILNIGTHATLNVFLTRSVDEYERQSGTVIQTSLVIELLISLYLKVILEVISKVGVDEIERRVSERIREKIREIEKRERGREENEQYRI